MKAPLVIEYGDPVVGTEVRNSGSDYDGKEPADLPQRATDGVTPHVGNMRKYRPGLRFTGLYHLSVE